MTETIDLRSLFCPVRHQGDRPTCLAFAASDAHGSLYQTDVRPLSAEFAHYAAARRAPTFQPQCANRICDIEQALHLDGQPSESYWPYLKALPSDLTLYAPPPFGKETRYKAQLMPLPDYSAALSKLTAGIPVLVCLHLSLSFHYHKAGDVLQYDPDQALGAHAVVVMGSSISNASRQFVLRNSWGDTWADSGYGHATQAYLEPRTFYLGAFA